MKWNRAMSSHSTMSSSVSSVAAASKIYKKLARHFLEHTETVHYDGKWRGGTSSFVSYVDFVKHWSRIRFGVHAPNLEMMPLTALEETLKALGAGSKATFHRPSLKNPDAVVLEIVDPKGILRYRGKVYHEYEDAEWFRISVRLACESALTSFRKDATAL